MTVAPYAAGAAVDSSPANKDMDTNGDLRIPLVRLALCCGAAMGVSAVVLWLLLLRRLCEAAFM